MSYCKWMEKQSQLVKILFCLPVINILWGLYRVISVFTNFNAVRLILAILWLILGPAFLWLVDLICILVTGHIFWFKA